MSLAFADKNIGSMYAGGRKIAEAWLGSSKVFGGAAPSEVTIGGRTYSTVTIGNQVWMAENLDWKFSGLTFRDGVDGNEITNNVNLAQAAYYDYDESTYGVNGNKYGLLYNWTAVDYLNNNLSELGVPSGWHVPTRAEWTALVSAVGVYPGTKLKSTTGWSSGAGTDDYGFSAVPAGRWYNGFINVGSYAFFWTSEPDGSYAWSRYIGTGASVREGDNYQCNGVSVRLVKNLSNTDDDEDGGELG